MTVFHDYFVDMLMFWEYDTMFWEYVLDNLRKDWNIRDKLLNKETDLGWDSEKNTVLAPEEWWNQKIKENPEYKKFRHRPLLYVQELTPLFQPIAAWGTYMWTPAADDPQDVGGTNSGSKRKKGESGQNKKGKCLATIMVDSLILNSIEGGTKLIDQIIVDVAKKLYGIEEISCDEVLLGQCVVTLLDKTARDMYIGLRDNRRALVAY
ncbi:uncharacterized protein LOC129313965 [Prosopis cineraria]|uniref:uncharacterized protein LOC129313965 n=1 Tax=Prosopis cineraria TaxID=364024 RepID=UPI0024107208|nr:uncharacterized protein LOC129313965 [Prosopis cineraria]